MLCTGSQLIETTYMQLKTDFVSQFTTAILRSTSHAACTFFSNRKTVAQNNCSCCAVVHSIRSLFDGFCFSFILLLCSQYVE